MRPHSLLDDLTIYAFQKMKGAGKGLIVLYIVSEKKNSYTLKITSNAALSTINWIREGEKGLKKMNRDMQCKTNLTKIGVIFCSVKKILALESFFYDCIEEKMLECTFIVKILQNNFEIVLIESANY